MTPARLAKLVNFKTLTIAGIGVALFLLKIRTVSNYDTFFGLKIGQFVLENRALPTREIYSWSAQGREWVPYEWLAQTWIYILNLIGGLPLINLYVAAILVMFFGMVFLTIRLIGRGFYSSLALALFTTAASYEFFVERPQILAFLFFVTTIYLIWLFILKGRDYLLWLLPLTYIWTNSHASFIFVPALLLSYSGVSYLYHRSDQKRAVRSARRLAVIGAMSALVTLLPPLWGSAYQLIGQFLGDLQFLSQFIVEWNPLSTDPTHEIFYYSVLGLTALSAGWSFLRKSSRQNLLLVLPLLAISLASAQSVRHIPFGATAALLSMALLLPNQLPVKLRAITRLAPAVVAAVLIISGWLIWEKRASEIRPDLAPTETNFQFLKDHQLSGHMFNEYAIGGNIIYYLYPRYQVFFDGRADIYHCCEMRDYWSVTQTRYDSREEFGRELKRFIDKYNFSYFVIGRVSANPLFLTSTEMIGNFLLDEPSWRLIYFDDELQIILRDDGKNNRIYQEYGLAAATPYRVQPYRTGQRDSARAEYQRILDIKESGIAHAALGQILLEMERLEEAKVEFKKAQTLGQRIGTPELGLGRVSRLQGNSNEAKDYYLAAIAKDKNLGAAYLELGQLYQNLGQKSLARDIWEKGLAENIDLISRQRIIQLESAN